MDLIEVASIMVVTKVEEGWWGKKIEEIWPIYTELLLKRLGSSDALPLIGWW